MASPILTKPSFAMLYGMMSALPPATHRSVMAAMYDRMSKTQAIDLMFDVRVAIGATIAANSAECPQPGQKADAPRMEAGAGVSSG